MQKKGFIAVLSAIVLMIIASVSLVLAVGHNASAAHDGGDGILTFDRWEDYNIDDNGVITWLSNDAVDELYRYGYNVGDDFEMFEFYDDAKFSAIELVIPEGVKEIGWYRDFGLFIGNDVTSVVLPDGLEVIGQWAFCNGNFDRLTSITIPDSVTSIGEEAFEDCTNLTRVTLGNGVKTIGNNAFRNCDSLTSIIIPASVERVEGAVFTGCDNLTIYCECSQAYAEENWNEDWTGEEWYDDEQGEWVKNNNIVWNCNKTITFDADGGNNVADQIVCVDSLVTKPTDPTKEGYTFKGWYNGDDEYDFATPVTADMTLTAQWEAIPEPVTPEPEPEQPTTPENPEQPTTPDTDTETVTAGSKNGFNLGAAIGGGLVAGLGTISAIAATVIVRRRHK